MASKSRILSASDEQALTACVQHLKAGDLVAVPTETVYGLAADALNYAAVQHIYTTKGRPSNNPLICHVAGPAMAAQYVDVPPLAETLMNAFWPGPLTLVLPLLKNAGIPDSVTASLNTLAVRCPATEVTRSIIEALDSPIAAPSANPSGQISPTCAKDVQDAFDGHIPLIIDGGQTDIGIESTIVAVEDNAITLLRPGSVTPEEIENVVGVLPTTYKKTTIVAPGQLASHYAPNAAVELNVTSPKSGTFHIGYGAQTGDLNLSPKGDLSEAAYNLFSMLKEADQKTSGTISIAPIPEEGIGIAINDRLRRAAAPRT